MNKEKTYTTIASKKRELEKIRIKIKTNNKKIKDLKKDIKAIKEKIILNKKTVDKEIKDRLKYLKEQIQNENISYGEIAELQDLSEYIDKNDITLLEWAGINENKLIQKGGKN